MRGVEALAVLACAALAATASAQSARVVIGSKNFTESGVLAELMAQVLEERTDLEVERRIHLGGTTICWAALRAGEIDIYADYTGTGWAVLLGETGQVRDPLRAYLHVRRRCLREFGVQWLEPFGLNNSYALAMAEDRAESLGIRRISDLVAQQDAVRAGFSIEFSSRDDGYPGLAAAYGLRLQRATLEHGLAYAAIDNGAIDLIDAYSTDGKLLRYRLRVLEDDRHVFPPYQAAPLVRVETLRAHPQIEDALGALAFRIGDVEAQALNYVVETRGVSLAAVARAFLEREGLVAGTREATRDARAALDAVLAERPQPGARHVPRPGLLALLVERGSKVWWLALQHLGLSVLAVLLAAAIAVPLGIAIVRRPRLRQVALGAAGVMQTIPSLALLAFMIPLLGLGVKAAVAALLLYAILPILRNTYTGITEVDADLVDAARGIGLSDGQILRHVQLPLALRTIMAGIRTAAVISIGVATLAAFIGAGGLGEPIVEGLYLNDKGLILLGAVPAALLAIVADVGLGRVETALQPRGQRP